MNRGLAWMHGDVEADVGEGLVGGVGDGEEEVTVLATTADGGDRHSVGIDLLVEKLDGAMVGLFVVGLEERELGMRELVRDEFGHGRRCDLEELAMRARV
jgi:hypothetical protein